MKPYTDMNRNANSLGIFTESVKNVACPSCNAELDVSDFQVFEEITCPSCNEKFQVPGRLGGFILIEELGRGAMGCVYLAMDESLQRLVALKVIRKEYGSDPKMLETVQREAQAMATLNHRNIVQVYAFGRVNEQPYFVMELLEGERLDEMMEGGKKIAEIRALEIALDVAQGLDAADKAGLTHGDIKPANILMNEHGVAKVVDFGLARFMEPGAEIEVWGTPYYIAPEKARKKGEDSRSDQYSLGGTIFHALAGQPPFDGANPTKVVVAALKEETPNLLDFNENVTEKTAAVIRRMMEKNPNRRYPTYASLLSDLSLALKEAKEAEEQRKREEQRLHEKQNKKMNPLIPIILVITLLVTAVIGVIVWKQTKSAEGPQIQYLGPQRSLAAPFTRSEIRNLTEAVKALKDKNITLAEKKMATAEKHIPEQHAALAWAKFLEAGMYFYAQYPERAKELLEEVASTEDLIYDADKPPSEDPQLLANYALGNVDNKDLEKAMKKSDPYYSHMAELAKGYRLLLGGDANSSGRHFKYYAQLNVPNASWPYLLQPIASVIHVPGEKLMPVEEVDLSNPNVRKGDSQAQAASLLAGIGIRSSEGYPLFKINSVSDDGKLNKVNNQSVKWNVSDNKAMVLIPNNHMLVNASGVQVLPQRSFTLIARMKTSDPADLNSKQSDVLFHFGADNVSSSKKPGAQSPVKGMVVEILPASSGDPELRVRWGDGEETLFEKTFSSGKIRPGLYQAFALSWDGFHADGSNPSYQLSVYVNGDKIGDIQFDPDLLNQVTGLDLVSFGAGINQNSSIGWDGSRLRKSKVLIFDQALNEKEIQQVTKDLF
ncbi:serine/threonine-protein kinase [Kiritimatiellota bacterium B12222]|nr:serine/threonine-protein kinase [Kiritimatiellota bacterium B12222]